MDDLAPIIEEIGSISDKTEAGRWQLAEAIYSAFEELPSHTQGLLQGLCTRLKYTSTNIYNYKNAWDLRNWYPGVDQLSVSHFAKMYKLSKEFDLTGEQEAEYIHEAIEEGWSVRQLAQEVANNHDPDQDLKDRQYFETTVKRMRKCWSLPLFNDIPKETRAVYYDLLKELEKI